MKFSSINALSPENKPISTVKLNKNYNFRTVNSFGEEFSSVLQFENYLKNPEKKHPVSGPFLIPETKPGDSISVKILDIKPDGNYYQCISFSTGVFPGFGKMRNCRIFYKNEFIKLANRKIKISPSIGFIAVTPLKEISCGRAGNFGGNLDFSFLKKGSKIHLPVFIKGTLLAVGDVHAAVGGGEISGTGAETSALLNLKITRSPHFLTFPLIEDRENYYFCGTGTTLNSAIKNAARNAIKFFKKNNEKPLSDIYLLLGLTGNIILGNATGKTKTAAVKISKSYV